ncbi:tetratricopeptide repeat protein, partial [Escherichia coli]
MLGPNHEDVAESMRSLANNYSYQGKYEDAEPLYKKSLIIYENSPEPNHPEVATNYHNLAVLYYKMGQD